MLLLFISVCLIIVILILLMFLILKKTVKIVNSQTKSYFVNKLQNYDNLIEAKENKLNEIEELIKNRETGLKEKKEENKGKEYNFDTDVIDLLNQTKYQDKNVFELNKKIDEKFVINYEELIKDFLSFTDDNKDYDFCSKLMDKFDSDTIYKFKTVIPSKLDEAYREYLNDREYSVYEAFKLVTVQNTIENFIDYLDRMKELNSPYIKILVGSRNENYNYLSEYIETIFSSKIYRGIKIIYKNKIYDFSLSERDV